MKTKIFLFILIFCFLSSSCSKKNQQSSASVTYPVKVVKAEKKEAHIYIDSIGHVTPILSVKINSRIEGQLMEVHFNQGDEVKEDDLLFTIDPRPYQAELDKAMGLLDESIANLYIAKDRFKRNKDLAKEEYISQLDFETLTTDVAKGEALVKQNQANVENAKLNLDYCYIYSPISGKTGILQIDKGNMIYPSDRQDIISINQIAPIYVNFTTSEKNLSIIQSLSQTTPLKLQVAYEDLSHPFAEGTLDMIDNQVDQDTGLITFKAIFDNSDRKLWPGKFVKTRLILKTEKNAILIPFKALHQTASGPIVFVIKDDDTADLRQVQLGQRQDDNIIILKGVEEGEQVVMDGQLNLSQGTKVTIKTDEKK